MKKVRGGSKATSSELRAFPEGQASATWAMEAQKLTEAGADRARCAAVTLSEARR